MLNQLRLLRHAGFVVFLCVALSACGGGGGGGYAGPATYTIDATVTGYSGTGLELTVDQNGSTAIGSSSVMVTANGTVALASAVAANTAYSVTVATQPSSPMQVCSVANGSGTVSNANITNISVSCTALTSYAVNATVSGLSGTGFVLNVYSEVVNPTGGDSDTFIGNIPISANGTITLAPSIPSNAQFLVQITTQPSSPSQTCTISNANGSLTTITAMPVSVSCALNYTVSASVSGLPAGGAVLQLNGGDNLTLSANGVASFTTPLPPGAQYTVTALPASPGYCTVLNPTGNMPAMALSLNVTCGPGYSIGGTISGLSGLTGVTLQLTGYGGISTELIRSSGAFTYSPSSYIGGDFTTALSAPDAPYAITVVAQPTLPTQTCAVVNGTGTFANADVTNVQINCTPQGYAVTGNVYGLTGQGLVLQINGTNNLSVTQNGAVSFPTPVPTRTAYTITVATQPSAPSQTCSVGNAQGTIATANVTDLQIVCLTPNPNNGPLQNAYFIGTPPNATSNSAVLVFPANQGGSLLNSSAELTPVNPTDAYVAVANDAAGNLYVAAVTSVNSVVSNPRVLTFPAGSTGAAAPASSIALPVGSSPQSIAVDGNGDVYVSGTGTSSAFIFVFAAGSSGSASPTRTLVPAAACALLAADAQGDIVCAALGLQQSVSIYGPTQTGNAVPARFFNPGYPFPEGFLPQDPDPNTYGDIQGLALDPAGDIYMAIATDGLGPEAILKATGGTAATDNGTLVAVLNNALLDATFGALQFDAAGNLYVSEPVTATENILWRFAAQNGSFAAPTSEGLSFQIGNVAAFAVH